VMSVPTAILILVSALTLLNTALIAGIVRQLRNPSRSPLLAPVRPAARFAIDLGRENGQWPAGAQAMVRGESLIAFVGPGCPGCESLQAEVRGAGRLELPLIVVVSPHEADHPAGHEYLRSWESAAQALFAPVPFQALDSFGCPDSIPTLLLVRDGVVQSSARRLRDLGLPVRAVRGDA
jgi:hypothetical protein